MSYQIIDFHNLHLQFILILDSFTFAGIYFQFRFPPMLSSDTVSFFDRLDNLTFFFEFFEFFVNINSWQLININSWLISIQLLCIYKLLPLKLSLKLRQNWHPRRLTITGFWVLYAFDKYQFLTLISTLTIFDT